MSKERELGISPTGSKPELTARISAYLAGEAVPVKAKRSRRGEMPEEFTLDTCIGEGWRCKPALGKFLRKHAGKGFRFNAAVRDFVHTQVGQPVSAILECYKASIAPDAVRRPLPPQLEYNRHMQDYSRTNPGASRDQILEAWRAKRARPRR